MINEELIKRIDNWPYLDDMGISLLFDDCRSALLSQSEENKSLSDLSVKDILLINELNDKIQKQEAEIKSLQTKKYVPLKPLEWAEQMPGLKEADLYKVIMAESIVIRHAGLEVQE